MNIDLSDSIALVTGSSRGIGRAIALCLAGCGATVIINYNKSREKAEELRQEITGTGRESDMFRADIADPEQVKSLFAFISEKYGRLDVLVNNAGVIKDNLLLAMDLSEWDRVIGTNLRGAFLCTKYAAEMMIARHSGSIVNISSISAIRGGRGQTNYAAAKGGILSFTRSCAIELAAKGIRVNAVLPGMIMTEMSARVRKRAGDRILDRIPAARFGEPEDVANVVAFLASAKSGYVTGQAICIDGGMSIS